jgi:hypothetical protein
MNPKGSLHMLGTSSNAFDFSVARILSALQPRSVLDVGAGTGKIASIGKRILPQCEFTALQKLFSINDADVLKEAGYSSIIDREIISYTTEGFDQNYDVACVCDVIEHLPFSDALSTLKFLAYRTEWILLLWPSRHPQNGVTSSFDRHRFSMNIRELTLHFDIVRYEQSGFSQLAIVHEYNLALIRGDMNVNTLRPF